MKRRWLIGLIVLAALLVLPEYTLAADAAVYPDTTDLETAIGEVADYLGDLAGADMLQRLWDQAMAGELSWDAGLLWQVIRAVCLRELTAGVAIFAQLLVLSVFSLLLAHLGGQEVAALGRSVVWLALLGIVLQVFRLAGDACSEALDVMSGFVYALLPVLLTLLASLGAVSSVGVFNPVMLAAVSMALHICRGFVLPLLQISGALTVGSNISPHLKMSGLAKLCRDLAMGVFGITLTLFSAVLGLLGLTGSVVDGLGMKAVKSASGIFIPVVGRTVAEVLDTVISTSLVLKNTIGMLGLLVLLLVCVLPAVKILALALMFRLAGALAEPLGDARLATAYNALGGVVMLFFAVTAAAGIFFFFIVSITIAMGNLTVALR
ncbi:MAG: stage III sporulation protein AE [Firmicutes bacterium]|nr:stage III sporulation protein AE [Bacillota bacterium]